MMSPNCRGDRSCLISPLQDTLMRRTKIIATLGPAVDRPGVLEKMLIAGVDVVRLNLSHGSREEHLRRAEQVRNISKKISREVGIMADLPGAKIRITGFKQGKVEVVAGDSFILDPDIDKEQGDETGVGINFSELASELGTGDILLLDDGRILFEVERIAGEKIHCQVREGGTLSARKGLNRLGGGLSLPPVGHRITEAMELCLEVDADFVAISFPASGKDMDLARRELTKLGFTGALVAKIERSDALDSLDEIMTAADCIMVARGDLGVEIGDARLPEIQKRIIKQARTLNRVVITATQMMESMIHSPIPTRAEVFDVANAVIDGTDAVMLSAESAVGHYPVKTVERMADICVEAEKQRKVRVSRHRLQTFFTDIEETLAMAVMYAANHLHIKAIGALTESGKTAKLMSRISSGIPIYGLSRNRKTLRKMTMYRGVFPLFFDIMQADSLHQHREAVCFLSGLNGVCSGDFIITSCGDPPGKKGGTNSMKIVRI